MFWCKRFCRFFFSSYFGDGYLFTPPTECSILLDAFADYASSFTRCSIKHARPIRLCEECIDHYVNFSAKYKELLTTEVNGTSCKSIFISHDRLDAVLDYHDNILLVWDKGNCNGSYNIFYKALFYCIFWCLFCLNRLQHVPLQITPGLSWLGSKMVINPAPLASVSPVMCFLNYPPT